MRGCACGLIRGLGDDARTDRDPCGLRCQHRYQHHGTCMRKSAHSVGTLGWCVRDAAVVISCFNIYTCPYILHAHAPRPYCLVHDELCIDAS